MRHFIPLLSSFLAIVMPLSAQDLPQTQHIYTTVRYEIDDHQMNRGKQVSVTNLLTGSCWVTTVNNEPLIVTAAHNLALKPHYSVSKVGPYDFDLGKSRRSNLRAINTSTVVGLLAREIKEVGLLGNDTDCVLLRPTQQQMLAESRRIPLATTPVRAGDLVSVSGYPGTAMEKTPVLSVDSVALNGRFIALSQPLDAGYSGGVVLNANKEAVGVVISTDKKQAIVLLVSETMLRQATWKLTDSIKRQTF